MTRPSPITVIHRRVDGAIARQCLAIRLPGPDDCIRAVVPFGTVVHTSRGRWTPETAAVYCYWPDRWHNVISVIAPDDRVVGLYCDVLTPPIVTPDGVEATDLDLDVWVRPDWGYRVLDEDEFDAHANAYPPTLRAGARRALADLTMLLRARSGPFATDDLFGVPPDAAPWLRVADYPR